MNYLLVVRLCPGPQKKLLDLTERGMDAERECNSSGANNEDNEKGGEDEMEGNLHPPHV